MKRGDLLAFGSIIRRILVSLPREAHWVHYVPRNDIIFGS